MIFIFIKKCVSVFIYFFSFYLMLALATFYPFDDTCFQFTGNGYFHNACGRFGAFSSDILFFFFGLIAYFVPGIVFFLSWVFDFNNKCLLILFIKVFGSIILLFSLCGLAEVFFDDFYSCLSGGVIGYFLRFDMLYIFNDIITNIFFLFF